MVENYWILTFFVGLAIGFRFGRYMGFLKGEVSASFGICVLHLLEGREMTVPEIIEIFAKDTKPPSLLMAYQSLHRMEKKGMVIGRWGEATPERGGNRKRYYRLNKMK